MLRWVWLCGVTAVVILLVAAFAVAEDLPGWLRSEVVRLPILRVGDEGEWVTRLQEGLRVLGVDPGPVDGLLGPMTQEAVRRFQAASGLSVDGVVGTQTWQALAAALLEVTSHPPDPEMAGDDSPVESIPARGVEDADFEVYTIRQGDTLVGIANRFGVGVADLLALNSIPDPDTIQAGQALRIRPGSMAGAADGVPGHTGADADTGDTYVVSPGDTLFGIAGRFGISVIQLAEINGLEDPDAIYHGQVLKVAPRTVDPDPDPGDEPAAHTPGVDGRTWHEEGWFTYLPPREGREPDPGREQVTADRPPAGVIALTFNDGPCRAVTTRILEVLAVERVPATFFVVGQDTMVAPDLVRRMATDGHQVENHSYTHTDMTVGLLWSEMKSEVSRTAELVESLTGRRTRYFRPPYGAWNQAVVMVTARQDHDIVLWSNIGAVDFPFPGQEELARRLGAMAFPGAIIMLHANLPDTAEALPLIIATLRERGFEFATLDELPGEPLPAVLRGD